MSKALVVYGTKSGCTAGIAEQIGQTLASRGIAVDVLPAEKAGDPAGYDAVIVGSGVRVGAWHAAARSWVTANAETLKTLPVAFFTCGLVIREEGKHDEVAAYTDKVIEESGITPVDLGLFAGWNEPKAFSLPERMIMKVMKAPQGDFRDNSTIAEWTETAADKLGLAA